jgi:hypothetical protein
MSTPPLIKIGARIINLDAIPFIKLDGPQIVSVRFLDGHTEQFLEREAELLLAALSTRMLEIG